ncbi:MAG: hypothetical protein Q8T08_19205, partial [Ignavibacteria bacterium]|nr:hypothetical protein [Ignavibacteria bacterium]
KSPEALNTMVNAVRGGLMGGKSPQVEALQYSVLSKINPGASMFQLMEMRENPFSKENQKYLPEYLKQLKKMSGGSEDSFFMNIMQQFGLSASMSKKLGSGYLSGKLDAGMMKDFAGAEGIEDLGGRAEKSTAKQDKVNAEWMNSQIKLVDAMIDVKDALDKIVESTNQTRNETINVADKITESGDKVTGAILRTQAINPVSIFG